jgi:hypothetical protein
MDRIAIGGINHSLAGTVKLQLHPLILFPVFRDSQGDLEPVISPARSELIPLLGGLIGRPLGLLESRLGPTGSGPHLELDVCLVVEAVSKKEGGEVDRSEVATLGIG